MIKKLQVGCDKDNVLARYAERFCEILEEKYSVYLPVGEVSHYRFYENHPSLTDEIAREIMDKYITGQEQIALLPIREAIDYLTAIKDRIELYIITGTVNYGTEQNDIEAWCEKVSLNYSKVIISNEKEKYVKEFNLHFMIEDRGDTALKIASTCPFCRVLLLNRPWNRYVDTKSFPNLQRCNDWYEINGILLRSLNGNI